MGPKKRITPELVKSYADKDKKADKTFKANFKGKTKTRNININSFVENMNALDKDNNLGFNNTDKLDPKYFKNKKNIPKKETLKDPPNKDPQDEDRFENYLLADLKKLIRNYFSMTL